MINHVSVAFSITPVFSLGQAPQLNQLQDKQLAEHVTKVHSSFEKKARRSHRMRASAASHQLMWSMEFVSSSMFFVFLAFFG